MEGSVRELAGYRMERAKEMLSAAEGNIFGYCFLEAHSNFQNKCVEVLKNGKRMTAILTATSTSTLKIT